MKLGRTYQALRTQVRQVQKHQLLPSEDTAFAYWFCQSLLANPDDHTRIKQALVGGQDDRNVDILYVNDAAKTVFICQTKYRQFLYKKSEPLNDVKALAEIARAFALSQTDLDASVGNIKPDARALLQDTWRLIRYHDYSLRLIYATTGKVSPAVREEADYIVESVKFSDGRKPDFEYLVYDGKACCRLFIDYQDLVPSIPYVDFESINRRFRIDDDGERLHSYVFPLPVIELRRLYKLHHERLFARNIRLWKGDETETNAQIAHTLSEEPHEFFYLNNGVTILASDVKPLSETKLRVFSPQIINGQQTTRTIARYSKSLPHDSEVLLKVIWKEAETDKDVGALRDFIRRVVRATNFQNKVSLSELASNDPEHITLDRAFRTRGWGYARKKGKTDKDSGDTPAWYGQDKPFHVVRLQQLTTDLASCRLDPQLIRKDGIESLFEEKKRHIYKRVFNERLTVDECILSVLCSYLAEEKLEDANSWNRVIETYGVYFIAYRIHELVFPLFKASQKLLLSLLGADKYAIKYNEALWKLRKEVGLAWRQFVERHIDPEQEISSFISDYATKARWDRHWSSKNNKRRGPAESALRDIEREVGRE